MGRFYITQNPDYSDIKHITHSLFTNEDGETYEGADDGQSIREYLGNRIKNDFEKGNTVEINGWILSVTEARQCAYLSLMP